MTIESKEIKHYTKDDILNQLEVFKETRCFLWGKVTTQKFWDIRSEVGRDIFREELGVHLDKQAGDWIAKVRIARQPRQKKIYIHNISIGDHVWIQNVHPNTNIGNGGFRRIGKVVEIRSDGKLKVRYTRSDVDQDFVERINLFVPIYLGYQNHDNLISGNVAKREKFWKVNYKLIKEDNLDAV
ncbi:MAG: hypothetical protein R6U96_14680 [Promethearchaeia archaeon]